MIGYIKGEVKDIEDGRILVISGNVGFNVSVPSFVGEYIVRHGRDIELYTYMSVREDSIQLYGFLTKGELDIYKLLISVSGIGPKVAMSVLSTMSPDDLRYAVAAGDYKQITKVPGLGAKTAQKLILEIKDKISVADISEGTGAGTYDVLSGADASKDAIMALAALGYSQTEAVRAVGAVHVTEDMTCEDVIKEALKRIV